MIRFITLIPGLVLLMCSAAHSAAVKHPNVSGGFYPADPAELSADVEQYLSAAEPSALPAPAQIILAPHAGYVYSGQVAGVSFKAVASRRIKTVVVLAPSHFFPIQAVSVWKEGAFVTPLGELTVDAEFAARLLAANDRFVFEPSVFEREHALEVELPFIQKTFSDAVIVPVIMGQIPLDLCRAFAQALDAAIGDRDDVLVVVSSDLSHYHDDAFARKMDALTLKTVTDLAPERLFEGCLTGTMEMCGCIPATTALYLAGARGLWGAEILRYANSGDVNNDKGRVVGYGAVAFYPAAGSSTGDEAAAADDTSSRGPEPGRSAPLSPQQHKELLRVARHTVESFVREGQAPPVDTADPRLKAPEGAFVTLHKRGRLRGCIGNIVSGEPLIQTVRDMAIAASSRDPRFPAVEPGELDAIDVEVSVLSRPWRIDDVTQFEPGVHGVIVRLGAAHQGVFLPQVADETGWGREEFLSQLCAQKAGLPPDAWKDPQTEIYLFTADVFGEEPATE